VPFSHFGYDAAAGRNQLCGLSVIGAGANPEEKVQGVRPHAANFPCPQLPALIHREQARRAGLQRDGGTRLFVFDTHS